MFRKTYTFDDIALVPQFNNIESRLEPDLSTWLTKVTRVKMPIVPSNMDTVISPALAEIIIQNGGYPIFHRFTDRTTKIQWISKDMFLSIGLKEEHLFELYDLLEKGFIPRGICIDIAQGHDRRVLNLISKIKNETQLEIIAGNVCTPIAYQDLVSAGADAIKVGIGPGSCCLTRMVTGFGVPQFSAIYDCAQLAKKLKVPLIADGGIRNSRDVVLALAAGASTVMIGKLFALTNESAAEKKEVNEQGKFFEEGYETKLIAKYRGQASKDFQEDYYGELREGIVAEGEAFWGEVSGPAQKVIDELLGGLRSGMTYGGARTIKELQQKAEFVEVTSTYSVESNTRK